MDIIKGIYAIFFIFIVLMSLNQTFTKHTFIAAVIEILVFIALVYFINWRNKIKNIEKNKYCTHNNLKDSCVQCEELNAIKLKNQEEHERRWNNKKLLEKTIIEESHKIANFRLKNSKNILLLSPKEFEDSIAKLFDALGYKVQQTPYTNDGGKDVIAWKDGVKYIIECKRYAVDKGIGRPMLQKFHSAMIDEDVKKGFFITTSYFTDTAIAYAIKFNIELIDNEKLIKTMELAYPEITNDFYFSQICLECGSSVKFQLNNENINFLECSNGHMIEKSIPIIIPQTVYKKKYKKKYRRY